MYAKRTLPITHDRIRDVGGKTFGVAVLQKSVKHEQTS